MRGRKKVDPLSRTAAIGLAAGRVGIGLAASFATRPSLKALGFDVDNKSVRVLGRMAGVRDLAVAGIILSRLDDRDALREATFAAAANDAGDFAIFLLAGRHPELRGAAALSAPGALAATAGGLWLANRLR